MAVYVVPYGLVLHRKAMDVRLGDLLIVGRDQYEVEQITLFDVGWYRFETVTYDGAKTIPRNAYRMRRTAESHEVLHLLRPYGDTRDRTSRGAGDAAPHARTRYP